MQQCEGSAAATEVMLHLSKLLEHVAAAAEADSLEAGAQAPDTDVLDARCLQSRSNAQVTAVAGSTPVAQHR
jgi:hypothetical protein